MYTKLKIEKKRKKEKNKKIVIAEHKMKLLKQITTQQECHLLNKNVKKTEFNSQWRVIEC